MNLINLKRKTVRTIVPASNTHYMNYDPIGMANGKIAFLSYPKNALGPPQQFTVNPANLAIKSLPITYRGKPLILNDFVPVR